MGIFIYAQSLREKLYFSNVREGYSLPVPEIGWQKLTINICLLKKKVINER